jgi:hypothetical protein
MICRRTTAPAPTIRNKSNDFLSATWAAILGSVEAVQTVSDQVVEQEDQPEVVTGPPSMAVSIAGISTACSKKALVSSAKAVREALSTE